MAGARGKVLGLIALGRRNILRDMAMRCRRVARGHRCCARPWRPGAANRSSALPAHRADVLKSSARGDAGGKKTHLHLCEGERGTAPILERALTRA